MNFETDGTARPKTMLHWMKIHGVSNPRMDRVAKGWEAAGIESRPEAFLAAGAIIRLNGWIRRRYDEILEPLDLTRTTFMLLMSLIMGPPDGHKMADLSEELMVRPTTVTLLVDQLADRKLVRRSPHPTDRRANLVSLTSRGRALALSGLAMIGDDGWGLGPYVNPEELLLDLFRVLRNYDDPVAEGVQ